MGRNYPRALIVAPVSPLRRGSLWVHVQNGNSVPLLAGGDREVKGKGRFTHPSFFCNDGNDIHVYTYTLRLLYEYTWSCETVARAGFSIH
jgi:hypothetical protein